MAVFNDMSEKIYGDVLSHVYCKIPYVCDVVRGDAAPVCTVETALPHLLTVDASNRLVPVHVFEKHEVKNDVVTVPGIETPLTEAYAGEKMPWEITDLFGAPTKVDLKNYKGDVDA